MSVAPIPLLARGIPTHVISVRFPEPGLLLVLERHTPNPFRALPEVEMWHEQARWTTVLWMKGLAVEFGHHPGLVAGQFTERQVRRIAAVGENRGEVGGRLHAFKES